MPATPDDDARKLRFDRALSRATGALRLRIEGARLLRLHASAIYALPSEMVVARFVDATDENHARADVAVRVTSWLARQGFPTVLPATAAVVLQDDVLVTLWRYLPQPDSRPRPPAGVLGALLRRLHALAPAPELRLPSADPLGRLRRSLQLDQAREHPVVAPGDLAYLEERAAELQSDYDRLDSWLGHGLIHNDAHVGNLLVSASSPDGYVLADWDGAAWGPREIDLVQEGAPGNRYGRGESDREAFCRAYGYDVADWPGWQVLQAMRHLHSLAAYIRIGPDKPAAAEELRHRLESLRGSSRSGSPWRATQ